MNINSTTMTQAPIHSDAKILSGSPVFVGTRVPAQTLFDYLADGCDLEEFLENFPTVKREQALQLLTLAAKTVQAEAR
jgi:uncharacterized protein (DUF433 family)